MQRKEMMVDDISIFPLTFPAPQRSDWSWSGVRPDHGQQQLHFDLHGGRLFFNHEPEHFSPRSIRYILL